jgi:hypothetical protein
MKFRFAALALCGAFALSLPATAQTIPDYLVHRVPTKPDPQPPQSTKTLADYILEGYSIVIRTRIAGPFQGCRQDLELIFEDRTRFECTEEVFREEMSPPVRYLENPITGGHVMFIGKHAYVGRLLRKKGRRLTRVLHAGEILIGIPTKAPDERRSIGPVDEPNGKIPPLGASRSLYAGSIMELSALPSNAPPAAVSLNPSDRNSGRRAAAVGLAHPQ